MKHNYICKIIIKY